MRKLNSTTKEYNTKSSESQLGKQNLHFNDNTEKTTLHTPSWGSPSKKRSPNDPASQGGHVDNRAAGTHLADHPTARQYSSLQESFSILLPRISWDNEAGRFSWDK